MNKYVEKAPVSEKEQAKEQQRLAILLRTTAPKPCWRDSWFT